MIKKNYIGIEFTKDKVRLIETEPLQNGRDRVLHFKEVEYGRISDVEISIEIKKALEGGGFGADTACVVLPDNNFIQKTVYVPKLSKKDLNKYILREVKKGLNLSEKEVAFDYIVLNESIEFGVKKLKVSALGAPKSIVARYTDIIKEAGLKTDVVLPLSLAMQKIMMAGNGDAGEIPVSLIYLGREHTIINVVNGEEVLFSRSLNIGIGKRDDAAEDNVQELSADGFNTVVFDPVLPVNTKIKDPNLVKAIQEIKRTLLYCKKEITGRNVAFALLAAHDGISDDTLNAFREMLEIEVTPWDMSQALTGKDVKPDVSCIFAIGAIMSARGERRFRLVPHHMTDQKTRTLMYRLAVYLIILFFLGGGLSFAIQKMTLSDLSLFRADMEKRIDKGIEAVKLSARYKKMARAARIKKQVLNTLRARQPDIQRIFKKISVVMPEGAFLKHLNLSMEGGRWSVSMKVKTEKTNNVEDIKTFAELIRHMERSKSFYGIRFSPIKNDDNEDTGTEFNLKSYLR